MKRTIIFSLFCIFFANILTAQEQKLSLEINSGHLFSGWLLNDSINARVMLETGFPKIIINETFALKYLQEIIKKAPDSTFIGLWSGNKKTLVSYIIKDSLVINGQKLMIDALVADFSANNSWKDRDIIFPLGDLQGITELNIAEKYMTVNKNVKNLPSDYIEFNLQFDDDVKGLYLSSTLQIFDSLGTKETLTGNFLLDLGAPNAMFLNRNIKAVETFVNNADRMLLKDTTKFKPNPRTNLAIIMPEKIQLENISFTGEYIIAMKMFGRNSDKYAGIIGNRFFAKFIVLFDFENNKIYLKPNSDKVEIF